MIFLSAVGSAGGEEKEKNKEKEKKRFLSNKNARKFPRTWEHVLIGDKRPVSSQQNQWWKTPSKNSHEVSEYHQ